MSWQQDEQGLVEAGDIGGDVQATNSWSIRFHQRAQHISVVTVYFYGVVDGPDAVNSGPYYLERQTEFIVCADPADPGGTELWSDYTYECGSEAYKEPAAAEAAARAAAQRYTADKIDWNGRLPWDPEPAAIES